MRLFPPLDGANTEHDKERKRSRPTSSLHVEPTGDKQQTTPNLNGGKHKPTRLQIQQQLYRQQLAQQEQQNMRPMYHKPTRAQGGGGLPRKSYSPYDHVVPGEKEAPGDGGEPPRKRSPYYRDKTGKVLRDEPEHLRAMMEEGIPVKQWLVLLVLLVVGLYQLRKTVLGPKANEKTSKKPPSPKKTVMKGQKKTKQKGKKNASGKVQVPRSTPKMQEKSQKEGNDTSAPVKSEASRSILAPTMGVEAGTASPENESVTPKKDVAPPVEAKKQKASKKKKKTASQPQKSNKDENASVEKEKQSQAPGIASANGTETTVESDDAEGGGWQTVGQGIASEQKSEKNVRQGPGAVGNEVVEQSVVEEKDQTVEETDAKSASVAPKELPAPAPVVADSAAETMEGNAKKNGKAKTKKNNGKVKENGSMETEPVKVKASSAPIPPLVASTDDDAALALKLQEEEERLAKTSSQPAAADTWAEVTPKKSRRRSNDPMVTAAH